MYKIDDQNHILGEPDRFLNLRHSTLPYWKRGQGPDLIFFHGWPFDARIWHKVVAEVEDSYTCHLFDLPGAGLSRISSATPIGFSAYTETAIEAVQAMDLNQGKLGFIGHDSGGSIARMVAASMPDRVAGMMFGNTEIPKRYSPLFRFLLWFGKLPGATQVFHSSLKSDWALSGLKMVGRGPGKRALNSELVNTYFGRLLKNEKALFNSMSILKSMHTSDFDQLAEAHSKIQAPVHLMWGAHDPWFPLKDAKAMLEGFAGKAELTVVDDASLMVHEEAPQQFAKILRELFQDS